jgi:UDP-glucose-4-epimerase GalE
MHILVTGGAGYIGSHTCKRLALNGHRVTVYDNLSTGWRDLVKWGRLVEGDLRDGEKLRKIFQGGVDGVIHFAAKSAIAESVSDPGEYYANNVGGTLSLLRAMVEAAVPHIVVSGTASVYGQPERVPVAEDAPLAPINPYGMTKVIMERMLQDFERAHGLSWTSLRYFNAAGCDPDAETGERHIPESHLIPRVLMAAAGRVDSLELFGDDYDTPDGTCIRDYIHVQDLAEAHILALRRLVSGGKSMAANLGVGAGLSIRQIIAAAENVSGKKVPYRISPRRPGDPAMLIADPSLAKRALGWTPVHSSIENIIATAWRWLQADWT